MPIVMTDSAYAAGLTETPDRLLIDHARWEHVPAGSIVRDIIERFITPTCYLIIPGPIADGPMISLIIGEDRAPGYRSAGDVLRTIAIMCGYEVRISLDGRVHFGPVPRSHAVKTIP